METEVPRSTHTADCTVARQRRHLPVLLIDPQHRVLAPASGTWPSAAAESVPPSQPATPSSLRHTDKCSSHLLIVLVALRFSNVSGGI